MNKSTVSSAVRKALVAGVVATAGSAVSAYGVAAETPAQGQSGSAQSLGTVMVTGSRIMRTDVETAQPVLRISREDIEHSGVKTLGGLLQRITSAGSSVNSLVNNSTANRTSGLGHTFIDLRYMGAQRVLVLVNGRRWTPNLKGKVDLKSIPTAIIDHIEVLQNGASALYGSDAIAGVINIITRKNYNGAVANAYYGQYWEGSNHSGNTQSYDFTIGKSSDQSSLLVSASYFQQDPIWAYERPYSSVPYVGTGNTRGSSSTPQGRFRFYAPSEGDFSDPNNGPAAFTGLTSAQCPTANIAGKGDPDQYVPACDLTIKTGTNGTSPSDFKPFTPEDRYNFAPDNYLLSPFEQTSLYLQGDYAFTPNVSFFASGVYTNRHTQQKLAPGFAGFSPCASANCQSVNVPEGQKYNPFPFDLNTNKPGAGLDIPNVIGVSRRASEYGNRIFDENVDFYQFTGGLQGNFSLGSTFWNWDASYVYGKVNEIDVTHGVTESLHQQASLGGPDRCGPGTAAPSCVPLNIFGGQGANGEGTITPEMINYLTVVPQDHVVNHMRVYEANLNSSNLAMLPAGGLGVAVGYQHRERDGHYQPDALSLFDSQLTGGTLQVTDGRYSVDSFYGEVNVPILANIPGAYNLNLDLASRRSDYSTFGSTTDSRAAVKWKPMRELLIRASWSQGFRAPNIFDLASGLVSSTPTAVDPCNNYAGPGVNPAVAQRCAAQGVPSSYVQANSQLGTVIGSNPDLQPETSISQTAGFVYSPEWAQGLSITFDYYKIELSDAIQSIGDQNILDGCYIGGLTALCDKIQRTRQGTIFRIYNQSTNIGGILTEGIDASFEYRLPVTSVGQFTVSANVTKVNTYQETLPSFTGGAPQVNELVGKERGGLVYPTGVPEYKGLGELDWAYGNWNAMLRMHYISDLVERCTDFFDDTPNSFTNLGLCSMPNFEDNSLSKNHIGSVTWYDAQVSYMFPGPNIRLTFGVNNLFDKQPPRSTVAFANSFDPTFYTPLIGRFPYLQAQIQF